MPNVVDADTSLVYGKPELRVEIDRQRAADLGVRVTDIATALEHLVAGQVVSSVPFGRRTIRRAAARRAASSAPASKALTQLTVFSTNKQGWVPLDQVVRIKGGTRAFEHRPPGPAAPGDHQRQRAAGRIAGRHADQRHERLHQGSAHGPGLHHELGVGQSKELAQHGVLLHRRRRR